MKTITVTLTQEPAAGLFRVKAFTNTVQLSIGQVIKADVVSDWCTRPMIQVKVIGMTPQEGETALLDRADALQLTEGGA